MIQLQSDTLFFIGNFTIFTAIETQSFVAPLVTRKSHKLINTIYRFPHARFASFSHCCGFLFAENPGTTGGPLMVSVLCFDNLCFANFSSRLEEINNIRFVFLFLA